MKRYKTNTLILCKNIYTHAYFELILDIPVHKRQADTSLGWVGCNFLLVSLSCLIIDDQWVVLFFYRLCVYPHACYMRQMNHLSFYWYHLLVLFIMLLCDMNLLPY